MDIDERVPEIPTLVSLVLILLILTVASLVRTRQDPSATAHAGAVLGARERERAER